MLHSHGKVIITTQQPSHGLKEPHPFVAGSPQVKTNILDCTMSRNGPRILAPIKEAPRRNIVPCFHTGLTLILQTLKWSRCSLF